MEKIISIKPLKIYPGHGKSFNYNCLENKINKLDKVKLLKLSEDSLLEPSVPRAELETETKKMNGKDKLQFNS